VGVFILVTSLVADAQPAGKVYRIGFLAPNVPSPVALDAFRDGLRQAGWVEGRNVVIDYRYAEFKLDRLPALAGELVRLKVDVIVTSAGPATRAAKEATATIPVVMFGVGEPVGQGLVASLARPGGNVTGLAFSVGTEVFSKDLELLKQALPKVRRVAVLANPASPGTVLIIDKVSAIGGSLGMELRFFEAREPSQFDGAFAAMVKERVEALLVLSDPTLNVNAARLVELAARHGLPAMYGVRAYVDAGGLMSYGPNINAQYRRAGWFVDKIFKGAKPADLPVEQPTTFELVINLKTAKALGLTIPQSLLLRADEVIE
jgi:putative ABC transport system substrate-binding protein